MKIAVAANGADLDVPLSPIFGRCSTYILVDTVTMQYDAIPNPAISAGGGAGVQAAQFVIERGAQAVVAGNVGSNAFDVFRAGGIPVYLFKEGTVQQAVEAYKGGRLSSANGATVSAHAGMGRGMGRGRKK
jgi:predicted Fe-Mo cluster-binding NifX family protein